jgi:uncharacterized protein (TIGR03067 family)
MSNRAVPFLACVLACAGCAKAPEDLTLPFQGNWFVHDESGKKTGSVAVFEKDVVSIVEVKVVDDGREFSAQRYAFRVDRKPTPAHIDFVILEGDNQGQSRLGVFAIDGDSMKLCIADLDASRPTGFTAGEKTRLLVLKREQ